MKRRKNSAEPPESGSQTESQAPDTRGVDLGRVDETRFEEHTSEKPDDDHQYCALQH